MAILKPDEIQRPDVDSTAIQVFLKTLEILGGPKKLITYRNLTWLPSLFEAAYVVVLANDYQKTEADIAEYLGITRQTVRNILRADTETVMKRLEGELQEKTLKAHIAGGLAKLAYEKLKSSS